jgi:hypothetical protein
MRRLSASPAGGCDAMTELLIMSTFTNVMFLVIIILLIRMNGQVLQREREAQEELRQLRQQLQYQGREIFDAGSVSGKLVAGVVIAIVVVAVIILL